MAHLPHGTVHFSSDFRAKLSSSEDDAGSTSSRSELNPIAESAPPSQLCLTTSLEPNLCGCDEETPEQPWSPFIIPHGSADVCIEEDHDPASKLLADGLEPLLKTIVGAMGSNPGIFISLQDLRFHAQTFEGSSMIATLGNQVAHWLTFWRRFRTEERHILKGVTGSFRQGCPTLLLGPPQSGKSSLMK
eukprot:EG_transcript_33590